MTKTKVVEKSSREVARMAWLEPLAICLTGLLQRGTDIQPCTISQDIPDVEGDKVFGIRSFSVRMGQKKVILKEDATCLLLFSADFQSSFIG